MCLVTLRILGNSSEPQEILASKNRLCIVYGMYTKTKRRVRVDDTLADEIQVNPELHPNPTSYSLFFVSTVPLWMSEKVIQAVNLIFKTWNTM